MEEIQHIYFYIDDSGKISKFEDYAIFAGIVFHDKNEKSQFTNKFRSIYNNIKCNYCHQHIISCNNDCPEVKGSNISNSDRRRLMQLTKQFSTFGTVIYNKNLKPDIVNRHASKGRFTEYALRRIIKETLINLIKENIIDPYKPVFLHVNIDEMPTKSNGYYSLNEGLYEEFIHGIVNWDYGKRFKPILFNKLQVQVNYKDSKQDVCIQIADIIANTIRRTFIFNNNWFDSQKYIIDVLKIDVLLRLPN